jgi:TetR/AcrR family transcriptional regulator, transcriptional repressor for nem operon
LAFENCSLNMHIGTYVRSQKQREMQRRCTARSGAHARALVAAGLPGAARSGFRSSDLDVILATAGVTKGALYYQFDNKEVLGYAVVDEIVASLTREKWVRPLQKAKNPIDTLIRIVQSTSLKPEDLQRGCPLNNLYREMSPLDAGFRERTAFEFPCLSPDRWRSC